MYTHILSLTLILYTHTHTLETLSNVSQLPDHTQAAQPGLPLQTHSPSVGGAGLLPTPGILPSPTDSAHYPPPTTVVGGIPDLASQQEMFQQQMKAFQMQQEMFAANPEYMNYHALMLQQNPALVQQMQLLWLQQQQVHVWCA